jgi:hypothetical protein
VRPASGDSVAERGHPSNALPVMNRRITVRMTAPMKRWLEMNPPIKAPMRPTIISTKTPSPEPFMSLPANQPANKPMMTPDNDPMTHMRPFFLAGWMQSGRKRGLQGTN